MRGGAEAGASPSSPRRTRGVPPRAAPVCTHTGTRDTSQRGDTLSGLSPAWGGRGRRVGSSSCVLLFAAACCCVCAAVCERTAACARRSYVLLLCVAAHVRTKKTISAVR
eukprot:5592057-Prymnesium_polylepis.3